MFYAVYVPVNRKPKVQQQSLLNSPIVRYGWQQLSVDPTACLCLSLAFLREEILGFSSSCLCLLPLSFFTKLRRPHDPESKVTCVFIFLKRTELDTMSTASLEQKETALRGSEEKKNFVFAEKNYLKEADSASI